jgi:drug/metabolite transporter superfamily protein YnfA
MMFCQQRIWSILSAALVALATSGVAQTQDLHNPVNAVKQMASNAYHEAAKDAGKSDADQESAAEETPGGYDVYYSRRQQNTLYFAVILAATALLAHIFVLQSLRREGSSKAPTAIVSATGLIYIIFGTILLVVIATTEQQLTASMGILGAVAGYLFGKNTREEAASA